MSAREAIRQKPAAVIQVIHCFMTKASLDLPEPLSEEQSEQLARDALVDWNNLYAEAMTLRPMPEAELAEEIVKRLRNQEVWGKILRGNAS